MALREDALLAPRSELEVAANAVWALIAAGIIPRSTLMSRIVEVTGIPLDQLRVASVRAERVPVERLKPSTSLAQPFMPKMDSVTPMRAPKPGPRLTDAGRRGASTAVFAELRRIVATCPRCGSPVHDGEGVSALVHLKCPEG